MKTILRSIEYELPENILTNDQLAEAYPEWSSEKVLQKTGIAERHIAAVNECASDLAVEAASKLFASGVCTPDSIDFILFCTQSADYYLPTTACSIQQRLDIPKSAGALDFNLGCSGYVYGLGLAKGLIETEQAENVLLLTADTYSKYIHPQDRGVRTLFGDAGSATLIQRGAIDSAIPGALNHFVYGTDGAGAENLIVKTGGSRQRRSANEQDKVDELAVFRAEDHLYMNGPEIFNFTLQVIPQCMKQILAKAHLELEEIDLFVFHQANAFILENLRKRLKIPSEKFQITMHHCGNTVSSSIPIALYHAMQEGKLKKGAKVLLLGFGVGYSWGGCIVEWAI